MTSIICSWDGEVFRPASAHWARQADKEFVVGERYAMEEAKDRSQASHNHYFAAVQEAWSNLPEHMAMLFPSSEHLRHWALIKAGYATTEQFVAGSPKEAAKMAKFMKGDDYSVLMVSGPVITRCRALSQSMKAMGKRKFEESKNAVLAILADLLQVETDELRRAA